jgi:trimeric autotransporter adhesin
MYSLMKFRKLLPVALVCFALLPQLQAGPYVFRAVPDVVPPPDGEYGGSTAEGYQALFSLTTGAFETAIGWRSLYSNTDANYNTGLGAGTLALNNGRENTATGAGSMLLNTSGFRNTAAGMVTLLNNDSGVYNGAVGAFALFSNTNGFSNNAMGDSALLSNVHGAQNTAVGDLALASNDITGAGLGDFNTAVGAETLLSNTNGNSNNAVGAYALTSNTTGVFNQAMGFDALGSTATGSANVAIGDSALDSLTGAGSFNTVIGDLAGASLTGGSDNIYIGATSGGPAVESGAIRIGDPLFISGAWIAGIFGNATPGVPVYISASGRLSTTPSSQRYKEDIKRMDKASEALFALKPVTFRYKKEVDATGTPQFGLVAEEVAKVNPDLVYRDNEGKIYSVRYEAVNAMLLNEFIKEHRTVEKQQATMASQEAQIKWLTETVKQQATQIQKVSAQLEMIRPTPQVVENH